MRSASVLILGLALALATPPSAEAEPGSAIDAPGVEADSDAGSRSLAPEPGPAAGVEPSLTVLLTSGDTLRAFRILPAGIDMVRIEDRTGGAFYATNRIRSVMDASGSDRTRDALDLRRALGRRLPPMDPSRSATARPTHYGPLSVTRAFPIIETTGFATVTNYRTDERGMTFQFDAGVGVNVATRDAIGMTLFAGAGDGAYDFGVRYRYRRWVGVRSSIDLSPGLFLVHDEPGRWEGKGVGWVGQIAFNANRAFGFALQVYTVGRERPREYTWYGVYGPFRSRDSGLMIGARLGGNAGLATGLGGALLVALARPRPAYPDY